MVLVHGVANVSTPFKRLFLRKLSWDAEKKGQSLADTLKSAAIASIQDSGAGLVLVATTVQGQNVTYAMPPEGRGYSPSQISEAIEELLTRYDAAVAALIDGGNPTPTDAQILTEMLALMVAITEVYSDFTDLRTA